MRTTTAGMATALAKTSSKPVFLVELDAGGSTYYWSDHVITVGGQAYEPRIVEWGSLGAITDRISGGGVVNKTRLTTSQLPSDISSLVKMDSVIRIYLFIDGEGLTASDREQVFAGVISDPILITLEKATFSVSGIEAQKNAMVGELLTADEYAGADPDAIGKMKPIVYGSVSGHVCQPVDVGGISTAVDYVVSMDTSIELTNAAFFPSSGTVRMDREEITYTGKTGNTLTGCTRGANSTPATGHDIGTQVIEIQAEYEYLVADHPVQSIGDVYIDGVRIVSGFTKVLSEGGAAFLRFDARPYFEHEASLTIADSLTVENGSHTHDSSASGGIGLTVTGCSGSLCNNIIDGNDETQITLTGSGSNTASNPVNVFTTYNSSTSGKDPHKLSIRIRALFYTESSGGTSTGNGYISWGFQVLAYANEFTAQNDFTVTKDISINDWADVASMAISIKNGVGYGSIYTRLYEVTPLSVSYTEDGTISASSSNAYRAGAIDLDGNSVAETALGEVISCDLVGHNIETPHAVIEHILLNHANNVVVGDLDASITADPGFPVGTKVGFSITKQIEVTKLCRSIAWQSLARFFWDSGKAMLTVLPTTATASVRAITKNDTVINSLSMKKTQRRQIINKIDAPYDYREDLKKYIKTERQEDAGSVASYGTRDASRTVVFSQVNDAATVANSAAGIISHFKDPQDVYEFLTHLGNADLQRGDVVEYTHDIGGGIVSKKCEVMETHLIPGSGPGGRPDQVRLSIETVA